MDRFPRFIARSASASGAIAHTRAGVDAEPSIETPTGAPQGLDAMSAAAHRAIILVVERDPHVRDLEAYFLNEAGFGVEFVTDGLAALDMARDVKPDIIITEILVPRLDGLALCRSVKRDPALGHTVVLVFSILAAEGRAREAGADAFLMKPLAERRLVSTVRDLLAGRAARPNPGT